MHINLDSLFGIPSKPQLTGVAVIDSCLPPVVNYEKEMTITRTPKKGTPRRRVPPKNRDYEPVYEPAGYCPKCRHYVPSEGVVCKGCNAFWHYTCAGVSQVILDQEWGEKDFLCSEHRKLYLEYGHDELGLSDTKEVKIRVKINSFTLNPSTTVKKLISRLNIKPKIEPKDQNQQFYIKISPPTFEILVANMVDLGNQWGISIKAGDVDSKGTNVGTAFNMNLRTQSGLQALTSVNCHITTSSIHIQLNKGTKEMGGWDEKVSCLYIFVTKTLDSAIKQIEKTEYFRQLKESMTVYLNQMKVQESLYPDLSHSLSDPQTYMFPPRIESESPVIIRDIENNPKPDVKDNTPSTSFQDVVEVPIPIENKEISNDNSSKPIITSADSMPLAESVGIITED